MAFRRRGKRSSDGSDGSDGSEADDQSVAETGPAPLIEAPTEAGPWDAGSVPDTDIGRLDLGGLQIPAIQDVEVRLETDPAGAVAAVLLVTGASTLQLGAFAAPRREGIWAEVRAELLVSVRDDGGTGEEHDGPFGVELAAAVPTPQGRQPVRFIGVDGPRWFLRGVFTGPAATHPAQAAVLEAALREVVVNRGGDPLPVRDPLPLVLPREVLEQHDAQAEADAGVPAPGMPERGPEITETR